MDNTITLEQARPEVQRRFITGVYLKMFMALAITAIVAYFTASWIENIRETDFETYKNIFKYPVFQILAITEIVLVLVLSLNIRKLSAFAAGLMFVIYSVLNGLTFSVIFIIYQLGSIAAVFAISAGMFLAMTIYGMFTKTDLNSVGRYLVMALFGLIITGFVNMFLKSSMLEWIYCVAGVGIFVGLTAWDTQKIKRIALFDDGSQNFKKYAVIGALELYLDFINIFLKLLSLFGKRK